jgi:DNA polymerase
MRLFIDTETFSETPIKYGTYRYVADCELMVVSWAEDDMPVQVWDRTADPAMPIALEFALLEADQAWAHNAMFDRGVIAKHYPHFAPRLESWRCSMVRALAHSLPGGLERLCEILQVPIDKAKHKAGKELVKLFCQPRPANAKLRRATRETHPVEWAQFLAYAGSDIEAMREIDKRLPVWNYQGFELDLWHLDQRVNDRGFAVDVDLAECAIRAIDTEQSRLRGAAWAQSDGALDSATQRDAVLEHVLAEYRIALPDLRASTLERRLSDPEIPEGLKELLRIRMQACTTSTSKYRALIRAANGDRRLRGTVQFNGAGRTGRWAGRTFQPHNLPRPSKGFDHDAQLEAVGAIKAGVADLVAPNVMQLTSDCLRGVIVAGEDRKLCVADLSNIEGRMLAWLAGESWKLQAFRDYDAGSGPDLYVKAYSTSFRVDPAMVDYYARQIGKVMELMLGYEGGVGAFLTGAATYGFDVEDLGVKAFDTIPGHILHEAGEFYDWCCKEKRPTFGLSRQAFVVCDSLKRMWRAAHPNVVSLWRELQRTCIEAVESPGKTLECRRFKVRRDNAWLRIALPCGRRALCYPQPRVDNDRLSYMGVNQYTKQWSRIGTYGGKLVENVTQAASRDVLADGMVAADAAGYLVVQHTHDELVSETPDTGDYTAEGLAHLMCTNSPWADGLPLAAAGFETYRYRKD